MMPSARDCRQLSPILTVSLPQFYMFACEHKTDFVVSLHKRLTLAFGLTGHDFLERTRRHQEPREAAATAET